MSHPRDTVDIYLSYKHDKLFVLCSIHTPTGAHVYCFGFLSSGDWCLAINEWMCTFSSLQLLHAGDVHYWCMQCLLWNCETLSAHVHFDFLFGLHLAFWMNLCVSVPQQICTDRILVQFFIVSVEHWRSFFRTLGFSNFYFSPNVIFPL
jgi:hypothetical protein